MNGSNGGTTFTDTSPSSHTITAVGNAQTTTAQSIFNGSSGGFDGAADWTATTDSLSDFAFGTGDFTVECYFRTSDAKPQVLVDFYQTANTGCWQIYLDAPAAYGDDALSWWSSNTLGVSIVAGVTDPRDGNWHHVAVSRVAGVTMLFVDGTLEGSAADTRNYTGGVPTMAIGAQVTTRNPAYDMNGNIAEVRIFKGLGRYSTSFQAPTAPFLDY